MVIYLRWTSCQPDFCSLSGSSDKEEFGSEDIFESDGQLSGRSEPADSIRISELEAFEKLREKNWKCNQINKTAPWLFFSVIILKHLYFQPQRSRCHSLEHFTVSCPSKTFTVMREEDAMVKSFSIAEDEEEPEFQKIFVTKVKKSWDL